MMFALLFRCTDEEQRRVAAETLARYLEIWNAKHHGRLRIALKALIGITVVGSPRIFGLSESPDLPNFPDNLDPADAEFENAIISYYNGISSPSSHGECTMDFATAIRSAIVARQINRWIQNHPGSFAKWRLGETFSGPTFLEDEPASSLAEASWSSLAELLEKQPSAMSTPPAQRYKFTKEIETSYKQWEEAGFVH
jgi:hypothetical protein